MKRNFDLILSILQDAESIKASNPAAGFEYHGEYDQELVNDHVHLLVEEGLLKGEDISGIGDDAFSYAIYGLTWKGHDFLEYATKDESIWQKGKEIALSQSASLTLDWLLEWLKAQFF